MEHELLATIFSQQTDGICPALTTVAHQFGPALKLVLHFNSIAFGPRWPVSP